MLYAIGYPISSILSSRNNLKIAPKNSISCKVYAEQKH
jgi:hypothetical protein